MKLSNYHKEQKNNVILVTDYRNLFSRYMELLQDEKPDFEFIIIDYTSKKGYVRYYREQDIIFDKIIISKVFTDTPVPIQIKHLSICEYGGTGFFYDKAPPLPYDIEHYKPDYHLYDNWVDAQIKSGKPRNDYKYYLDYSIGFTTRGCFRKCEFCVNKNYDHVELHSPLEEFIDKDRKYICLLDDNILGCKYWENIISKLNSTNKRFEFKQGMDVRLMSEKKAEILSKSNYIGDFIFAFDNIDDRNLIEKKLSLWRKYCNKTTKLYVFCAFKDQGVDDIKDVFERIQILMKHKCLPYIMRFKDYEKSKYKGMYINLARWCNQPSFFKKKTFREFCEANGEISSTMRYLNQFENDYPEIAKRYFDLRF